jgi:hypothetical protein
MTYLKYSLSVSLSRYIAKLGTVHIFGNKRLKQHNLD